MDFQNTIQNYSNIFWDFDGVIKESIEIKKRAFVALFSGHNPWTLKKIEKHHADNGGMSRYEKFPLYLSWTNQDVNDEIINYLDQKFRSTVVNAVINSEWVPGVDIFLSKNKYKQDFYLVSATPQYEIEEIIEALGMSKVFKKIYGSPKNKIEAISSVIKDNDLKITDCIMIGDSISDYEAAKENKIAFILRRNSYNKNWTKKYNGYIVNNFI